MREMKGEEGKKGRREGGKEKDVYTLDSGYSKLQYNYRVRSFNKAHFKYQGLYGNEWKNKMELIAYALLQTLILIL
jgi:hypothetical protein